MNWPYFCMKRTIHLSNEMAVYSSEEEANQAYNYYYGDESEGMFEG